MSEEHRIIMSKTHKGKSKSPSQIKKMKESSKKFWASERGKEAKLASSRRMKARYEGK